MIEVLVIPKQEFGNIVRLIQSYENQIENLQEQLAHLTDENNKLKRMNRELEWRVNPYSLDGDAICNSNS